MIEIRRYVSALLSSNMYVIVDGDHSVVIDPFEDISMVSGLKVDYILLTHEHFDHISGVNLWKKETNAPVLCSKQCAENISNPRKNLANHFKEFCELQTWIELEKIPEAQSDYCCFADQTFEGEERLFWGTHCFTLTEMPGHSRGSIGIMLDEKDFFSGDSLMKDFDIELRMPGGSRKLWETIGVQVINRLSDGSIIRPGHFESFVLHK